MKNIRTYPKSLGLIQLLRNSTFEHAMVFNSWPYFNEKLSLHCKNLTIGSDNEQLELDVQPDIVIIFYPEKLDFQLLLKILKLRDVIVLVVCSQKLHIMVKHKNNSTQKSLKEIMSEFLLLQ
jgi:hypothetical protein